MYEYLKGIITKITAKYIVLETIGIGYILHVANPYAYSGQINQEAQIYVHQVVREAADDNAGLVQAIETKNITYLTKFPKIGKKTAQQMVLDLEGKVVVAGDDLPAKVVVQASAENQELEEAMEAMLALGYKATELKKIKKFFEGTTDTAENYIKSALKMLVK